MRSLSIKNASHIEGYAAALQDIITLMTGDNRCDKRYDPMTVSDDRKTLHSYAFDLRDGGRHHPVSDYECIEDLKTTMLRETETCLKEVKPKTRKKSFTPPTQQEFIDYVTETLPSRNPDWTRETASRAAANRFDVYVESGWKDGFGKPMKVWKTKAINAILRENHWSYGSSNKSANVASEPVSQTHFGSRLLFPDSSN